MATSIVPTRACPISTWYDLNGNKVQGNVKNIPFDTNKDYKCVVYLQITSIIWNDVTTIAHGIPTRPYSFHIYARMNDLDKQYIFAQTLYSGFELERASSQFLFKGHGSCVTVSGMVHALCWCPISVNACQITWKLPVCSTTCPG